MSRRLLVIAALLGFSFSFIVSCASGTLSSRKPALDEETFHGYETAEPLDNPPAPPEVIETTDLSKTKPEETKESYFDWPVDQARFVRGFSLKPTGKRRRPHLGIDLASHKNTPILAAHNGTVIYVGKDFRGFGKMILIEGKSGWATLYAHLNTTHVKEGYRVRKGDSIATMGRTGRASGVHLHFEIRKDRGPVDPMLYLPNAQNPSSVNNPQDYED